MNETTAVQTGQNKGTMVDQFKEGDQIEYLTSHVEKVFKTETDKKGKQTQVFEREIKTPAWLVGNIVKLHKSGHFGVAEIKPVSSNSAKKISRRLQHVRKLSHSDR